MFFALLDSDYSHLPPLLIYNNHLGIYTAIEADLRFVEVL